MASVVREGRLMEQYPMIFTGDSVPKISNGTKTMTRRVLTKSNSLFDGGPWPKGLFEKMLWDDEHVWGLGASPESRVVCLAVQHPDGLDRNMHMVSPKVHVGDRFWVKEGFALSILDPEALEPDLRNPEDWDGVHYKADGDSGNWTWDEVVDGELVSEPIKAPWRSPLYMPRWASRLLLEVTEVGIERIQSIKPSDCWDEGIGPVCHNGGLGDPCDEMRAIEAFQQLWDEKNKKRGHGWAKNDWVILYRFKVVEK